MTTMVLIIPECQLITDASEFELGAVLEQQGQPLIYISRLLSPSEKNYSQIQKEALSIHWAVNRLHKYLIGHKFHIITDHKSLEYIFNPHHSLSKLTSSMLQRWSINLSAYDFTVEHRAGSKTPQADYLSRCTTIEPTEDDSVYFCNPLPIDRNKLIMETKAAYGMVLASFKNGWSISAKRKFQELYARRDELYKHVDGVISVND
jgi:hypothetical protein